MQTNQREYSFVEVITSNSNQQIKNIQHLLEKASYRRQKGLFIVEGIRMFLETPGEWVEHIYVSEEFLQKSIHADKVKKYPYTVVSTAVFKKLTATQTPQGILIVLKMPDYKDLIGDLYKESHIGNDKLFLILNGVQDPGNLGTMLRTAEAAGVSAVIMDRACADIFNPKVIRSTMGAIYRVPFVITEDLRATIEELKHQRVRMLAGHLKGKTYFENVDYSGDVAVMIGNEGNGLSEEIAELADIKVKIPMEGRVESLNAAISAALFMYEVKRNRTNN